MAYATIEELKDQIQKTDITHDDVLEAILDSATASIDRFCNRPDGFVAVSTATAREYAGSSKTTLWIDENIAVTLVEARSTPDDAYVAWSATDWYAFTGDPRFPDFNRTPYQALLVNPYGDYSYFPGIRKLPVKTVRVTAKWGYAVIVPDDIRQACITTAARWFKRGQGAWADTLASGDLGTLLYRQSIDPDIQMMLVNGRYKRPAVG